MSRLSLVWLPVLVSVLLPSVFAAGHRSHGGAPQNIRPPDRPPVPMVTVDIGRLKATAVTVEERWNGGGLEDSRTGRFHIQPWQYILARIDAAPRAIELASTQAPSWSLPFILTTANEAGKQFDLELVVSVENGLMLRGSDGAYSGDVFVGLLNRADRASTHELGSPVRILLSGQVDTIDPADGVELRHTNQPFVKVAVRARPQSDEVVLTARTSFDPDGAPVPIPVLRPRLALTVSPTQLQGYGLETADITVRSIGLPNPSGRGVTIGTTAGSLEPHGLLTLDGNGATTTRLRSSGLGETVVTAVADGVRDADPVRVGFVKPFPFLVAALAGGLVGGLLRRTHGRRRGMGATLKGLIGGALLGLVVVVLYAVGINLMNVAPSARAGEGLVFALAALASWTNVGVGKGKEK